MVTGQIHTLATLILVKEPPISVEFVAGWVPEPDWTFGEEICLLPLPEIDSKFLELTLLC